MASSWSPSGAHIDQALTNLVVKHPTRFRFIADEICNVTSVKKESDKFWKIDDHAFLDRSGDTERAPGGDSNKAELSWQTDAYLCKEQALHADLPDRTRDNADDQLGLEMEHVSTPRDLVLLAKEIRAAATLFSTTSMTNNGAVASKWNDTTFSNIKAWQDILNAKRNVRKFGSASPTHLAMGDITWTSLAKYLIEYGTGNGGVRWQGIENLLRENPDTVPSMLLGLRLLVGEATYSTANKPKNVSRAESGGNMSDVWADKALVFHKGRPGVKSVQLATRFMVGGSGKVRRGRYAGPRECDWFEYREIESGEKVIAASCGFLITNTEQ